MLDSVKNLVSQHGQKIIMAVVVVGIIIALMSVFGGEKITSQVAYVKMDIDGAQRPNRHLHLREVEFYDKDGARITPVGCDVSTAQSGSSETNCKSMQDGVLSTYWHSKYSSAGPSTDGGDTHFVRFVLPNDQLLKTMVVVSRFNNTSRYGMAYVEYEVNGEMRKKYASLEGELIKSGTPDEGNTFKYIF